MKKVLLLFIIVFLSSPASAAPLPWVIAFNESTKECAGYWGGDEHVIIPLPDGWSSVWEDWDRIDGVEECSRVKLYENPEACCKKLGYSFVSKNIGIMPGIKVGTADNSSGFFASVDLKSLDSIITYIVIGVLGIVLITSIIFLRRKRIKS